MPDVVSALNVATDTGKALLDQIVTQQAAIIAYANDFKLPMLLALAAMPLVLFVGPSRSVQRPAAGEVHAMD
jgi:MFS transporter, DHA2 family, multidrug resistance protein